jgi:hypothetical protein
LRKSSPLSTLNWEVATPTQQTAEAPWANRQDSQTQSAMNLGAPEKENRTELHMHDPLYSLLMAMSSDYKCPRLADAEYISAIFVMNQLRRDAPG